MGTEHWKRVQELFDRAGRLSPERRVAFLDAECAEDPDLRAEVESLLEHQSSELPRLPELERLRPDPGNEIPPQIGPYRLVRELGHGGMGVVYLAEQQEPVRRRVALKLIRRGVGEDEREIVTRFESERQALALMSHPNIARVFDAGTTELGRPYFVMEYVDGVPLTEHCDRNRLDIRHRLELFCQACEGIQHAHYKGVIHRDIKPSNVLVEVQETRGTAKIIDFGIAKAIERRLTPETLHTAVGQMLGTPAYMSPEQVDVTGADIDTRTDVYSLGVLLYELLVGARPFDSDQVVELQRVIREDDPPKPSTRFGSLGHDSGAVATNRRADTVTLGRQLRGDLDWIVMKALEKDRARRYSSVSELAADVRRHIADEPIMARPPSAAYRVRKFARRHRTGVAAASLVLLALIVGIVGTSIGMVRAIRAERLASNEADRANDEADTAGQVESFLVRLFDRADPKRLGRNATVREMLDEGATEIEGKFLDRPAVRGRLLSVIGNAYLRLSEYDKARPFLEESLELRRAAFGNRHAAVMESLNQLGNLENIIENNDPARELYEEALRVAEGLYGPEDRRVGDVLKNLGDVAARQGDLENARTFHERAIAIRERVYGPRSKEVAFSTKGLADLLKKAGEYEAAVPLYRYSLELRQETLPPGHPGIGYGFNYLAEALVLTGEYPEARSHFESAIANWRESLGPSHDHLGQCTLSLARLLQRMGRHDDAAPLFVDALRISEQRWGENHPNVAETLQDYAGFLREVGRGEEAEAAERRAMAILR